jgi:ankyrin repeat protein
MTKPKLIVPTAGQRGMTELHYAACCNDLDAVRAQVQPGVPVDVRDDGGWTPLHWSIEMAQAWGEPEQVVSLLLAAGASANAFDNSGFSVPMMGCGRNNEAILEHLVKAGADVQKRSADTTPLHEAAGCNFRAGVRRLLALGAGSRANRLAESNARAASRKMRICGMCCGVPGGTAFGEMRRPRGSGNSGDRLAPRSSAISLGRDPSVRSLSVSYLTITG